MTTPKTARPWYEDLTDGVTALREAAYEYQAAHRSALVLRDSVTLERRHLEEGRIHVLPLPGARGFESRPRGRAPHADAIFDLTKTYGDLLQDLTEQFEHAALVYASGACWAISQVQQGMTPDRVAFHRDADDAKRLAPGAFTPIAGLERYSERAQVTAAYERLNGCLDAAAYGEDLAGHDYLADHEATAMHDAWQHAAGTAPAAYAYGLLAERALRFALLGVRHHTPPAPADPAPEPSPEPRPESSG
jgi:hypothetical protein